VPGPGCVFGLLANCHVTQIFHTGSMLRGLFSQNYLIDLLTPESFCVFLLASQIFVIHVYFLSSCLMTLESFSCKYIGPSNAQLLLNG
jgi:hypothetical protein